MTSREGIGENEETCTFYAWSLIRHARGMRHSFDARTAVLCSMLIGFDVVLLHEAIAALLSRAVSSLARSGWPWMTVSSGRGELQMMRSSEWWDGPGEWG